MTFRQFLDLIAKDPTAVSAHLVRQVSNETLEVLKKAPFDTLEEPAGAIELHFEHGDMRFPAIVQPRSGPMQALGTGDIDDITATSPGEGNDVSLPLPLHIGNKG